MINFSIIVPTFNSPKKTVRLLKTLKLKTHKDVEVIIVDDQSTVNIDILLKYIEKFENISFFINPNKGAGAARNEGLKLSKGKWIIFADADDFFLKDYYESISLYKNSSADIIYFHCHSCYENSTQVADRHVHVNHLLSNYILAKSISCELALRTRWVTPWGKMINRKFILLNEIVFDNVRVSNDIYFSVKAGILANEIEGSDRVIYCITKSNSSLTAGKSSEDYKIRTESLAKASRYVCEHLNYTEQKMTGWSSKKWILKDSRMFNVSILNVFTSYIILKKNGLGLFRLRG
ncbi:glycosyltransferase family A protein [Enterococcus sp. CSURQ0835]|uniref:glycosyltransferase family A protein n=1 Tax=Enterococcus sp. CSURQ0835 TaxID=2681394 RepID=UPI00135897AA|nr:glycosyltransferase family 2 protein [Enterococcus sp. CSURQ0835]